MAKKLNKEFYGLVFGEGCDVSRLALEILLEGVGSYSKRERLKIPNKGRLFRSFSSVDLWINCAHNCSGKSSAPL